MGKRVNMMGEEEEKRVGGRGPRGIGMRVGMRPGGRGRRI